MGMASRPEVSELPGGGKFWCNTFDSFSALVYIPLGQPDSAVINYGYKAPYLIVFDDKNRDAGCALDYAERSGLADIARKYSTSVVFIRPPPRKAGSARPIPCLPTWRPKAKSASITVTGSLPRKTSSPVRSVKALSAAHCSAQCSSAAVSRRTISPAAA